MTSTNNSGFQIQRVGSLKDLQKKFNKNRPDSMQNLFSKLSEEKPGIFEIVNTSGYNLITTLKTTLCEYYQYRLVYYFLLYLKYQVPQDEQNTILIKALFNLIQHEASQTFSLPFDLKLSKLPYKTEIVALMKQTLNVIEEYKGKHSILYAFNSNFDYDVSFIAALHHLACNQGSLQFLLYKLGCVRCSIQMNQININDYIMKINRKSGSVEFKIQEANFHANCNTLQSFEIAQDNQMPGSLHFSKQIQRNSPSRMLDSSSNNFQTIQETMREIQSFDQDEPFISKNSSSQKILKGLLDQMPESISKSLIMNESDSILSQRQPHQIITQTSYDRENAGSPNYRQCSIRENMLRDNQSLSPMKIYENNSIDYFEKKISPYIQAQTPKKSNYGEKLLTRSTILQQHLNEQKSKLKYNRVINEIYFPNDLDYSTPQQCKPLTRSNHKISSILSHRKLKTASTQMKNSNNSLQQNETCTPRVFKNHFIETRNKSSKIMENQTNHYHPKQVKNQIVSQKQMNDFQENRRKLLQQYLQREKQRQQAFKKRK